MIGWLRAAWDDSRRAAYTRRGSNPMSREEWFDLHEHLNKLDAKIALLPTSSDQRKLMELLTAKDVLTGNATTADLDEYLSNIGIAQSAAPFTDAQEARIRELVLDETNRAWKEATKDLLGPTVCEVGSLLGFVPGLENVEAPLEVGKSVHQGLGGEPGHFEGVGSGVGSTEGNHLRDNAFSDGEFVGDGAPEVVVTHDASPSVGDAGAHSVGEGEVAGVETAAPVTDATDSSEDEAGCSAQVMLAGHVIDVRLTQNAFAGAVTMSINLPDGPPVWRRMTLGELRLR